MAYPIYHAILWGVTEFRDTWYIQYMVHGSRCVLYDWDSLQSKFNLTTFICTLLSSMVGCKFQMSAWTISLWHIHIMCEERQCWYRFLCLQPVSLHVINQPQDGSCQSSCAIVSNSSLEIPAVFYLSSVADGEEVMMWACSSCTISIPSPAATAGHVISCRFISLENWNFIGGFPYCYQEPVYIFQSEPFHGYFLGWNCCWNLVDNI